MRERRRALDWKQGDLARRLGVTQATVSAIETGDVRASSHVLAICRLLKMDVPVVTGSDLQRRWVEVGQVLAARMPATFLRHLEMFETIIGDVAENPSASDR